MEVSGNRVALAALLTMMLCAPARAESKWSYELTPFLSFSGLNGQQGIGDVEVDVDTSFKDLFSDLNIGGWLRFSARHEPWSFYAEVAHIEYEDEIVGPLGNTEIATTQMLGEAGISYWFNDTFSVYAGARYQDVDNEIQLGGASTEGKQSWTDGVLGAQWTPVASENWLVWLRGDVGGGSSDRVWLVEGGVGYSWDEAYALYLSYRLLDTDYSKDDFFYDMQQSGLMMGFGVRF